MKLPYLTKMNHNDVAASSETKSRNSGKTSRNGRHSSMNGGRRNKIDSVASAVAAVTEGFNDEKTEPPNRLITLKKVANEQRLKVRETRERKIEEERVALQMMRQDDLKVQVRAIMDSVIVDVRKDILLLLQERINEERRKIKAELSEDINQAESTLVQEVEKRITNGEPFEVRVARVQNEFEHTFNKILTVELGKIHTEISEAIDGKLTNEKRKWVEQFKRETDQRVRTAEEAIRSDFRVGLEDSQKQCGDILTSMQQRTAGLEQNLTAKIVVLDAENGAKIEESERTTRRLIDTLLDERDKSLTLMFNSETETLRNEVSKVRSEVTKIGSKCCVIL